MGKPGFPETAGEIGNQLIYHRRRFLETAALRRNGEAMHIDIWWAGIPPFQNIYLSVFFYSFPLCNRVIHQIQEKYVWMSGGNGVGTEKIMVLCVNLPSPTIENFTPH